MSNTFSEAFRNHPLPLNDIIPLDFSSIRTLPESHAWSKSNDNGDHFSFNESLSIPIIDLMDPNAMEQIGHACEKWGAFQLKNHGIPLSVIEDVEVESKHLFSLPAEKKLKALRSSGGATGYGRARISPFFPKYMWHEGFTFMGSSDDAKKIWPKDHAPFCDTMQNYQNQMKVLAEKLTHMILNFMGMNSEEEKKWVGSKNQFEAIQLNYYPCCPEPDRAMGLAPHTDTSFLTILHQTQTNGLQIFQKCLGWVPINPDPNTLVVNIGDILHILSNARFHCALHRAIVNNTNERYSVAYFYGPQADYVISPLVLNSDVPCFRALTVKDYLSIKAKNFKGALSLITTT
ncbi:PREDICTED: gibberellin 3-beta-dioxygenase 1-like [Lupinus angustifolius]|uniref:gibberellin 3-beta-dioxygenase 1-like n=1 Tax=Lupinus angustifolius TaxID=3871 RepID=UPI00092E9B03|nr:PREDICTED: gibberellin 3-beta-dioxygenase 1-like [Lupinus angustifolius]